MAVYAATVIVAGVDNAVGQGQLAYGTVDVTNYNIINAEITNLSQLFGGRAPKKVIMSGISDNGYLGLWDETNGTIKAYYPVAAYTPAFTGTATTGTTGAVKDDDNAATVGHALYVVPDTGPPVFNLVNEGSTTGTINDNDNAASDGTAVFVVIDDVEYLPGFNLGHLEFVSPTNAHGTCTIGNGNATLLIEDDDNASSNGTNLEAQAAEAGLCSAMAGTNDTLIPLSDGNYLRIEDQSDGTGPDCYFDEDGSNTYERLEAVVVDNGDETFLVVESSHLVARPSPSQGMLAKLVTVGPGATLSVGAVGSGGPTFQVLHDAAAAQMVGAATLNAIAAGAGFDSAVGGEQDVYIPLSNGEFIKVAYAASPTGVQVYWDHDAANNYERLLEVVVDNANEAYTTEAAVGWRRDTPVGTINAVTAAAGSEVATDVDVGSFHFLAFG